MSGELRFLESDDQSATVEADGGRAVRLAPGLVLIAVGVLAGLVLLGARGRQSVADEVVPVAADLGSLPSDLPAVELAVSDESGLRVVKLPSGEVDWLGEVTLDGAPLVVSTAGALVGTSATSFYPWDGTGPNRVGAGRPIALAGEDRVWLVDWKGSSLLTAYLMTFDGEVVAESDLGRQGVGGLFAAFFGPAYHPLLTDGRSVLALQDDGSTSLVATGELVATGANHLIYRSCDSEPSCRTGIIDLEGGTEREVANDLVADVRPAASAVSADGQWLAILETGTNETLKVVDLLTGRAVRIPTSINLPGPGSLSWTVDSRWVFVAGPRAVTAYDVVEPHAYELDLDTGPNARVALIHR